MPDAGLGVDNVILARSLNEASCADEVGGGSSGCLVASRASAGRIDFSLCFQSGGILQHVQYRKVKRKSNCMGQLQTPLGEVCQIEYQQMPMVPPMVRILMVYSTCS